MKLHLIGCDFLEQIDRLFIVSVFSFGKSDQHLVIARLAHDVIFPFRVRELLVASWLFTFLDQISVPPGNIELRVRCNPKVAFQLGRIRRRLGYHDVLDDFQVQDLRQLGQRSADDVGEDASPLLLGEHSRDELIARGIDMIDGHAGKALHERRRNHRHRLWG